MVDPGQVKELHPMPWKKRIMLAGVGVGLFLSIFIIITICIETTKPRGNALQMMPIIDGHNNLPWQIRQRFDNNLENFDLLSNSTPFRTDLPGLESGKFGAVFWAVHVDCKSQHKDAVLQTLEQIDVVHRLVDKYEDHLRLVESRQELIFNLAKDKIASFISISSGHSIQNSIGALRQYYRLGVRMVALASPECGNPWAQSSNLAGPNPRVGLTQFGGKLISEMNRLGVIIDLSYTSVETAKQVLQISEAPVVFSRSGAARLCNQPGNIGDDILRLVNESESLVMVPVDVHTFACDGRYDNIATIARHIDYIKNATSVDNVGIGSGFDSDGNRNLGLKPMDFPQLFDYLETEYNWSREDLEKLSGRNFLRILKQVEQIASDHSDAENSPVHATVPQQDLTLFGTDLSCLTADFSSLLFETRP